MLSNPWFLEMWARDRIEDLRREAAGERARRQAISNAAQELAPFVWREAFSGVDFRLLAAGPEMMIMLMRFGKGAAAQLHHHRSAQAGYVLEGRLRVTVPGQQLLVSAGQCYLLPPGTPHQIRALERTFVLDFFAPGQASFDNLGVELAAGEAHTEGAARPEASTRTEAPARPAARRRSGVLARPGRPRHRACGRSSAENSNPKGEEPRDAA